MAEKPGVTPYTLFGRRLLPYHGDIAACGAAVIVNSTGPSARLSNDISQAIARAAGGPELLRGYLAGLLPLAEGGVAITPAGRLPDTKYIFHVVPTAKARGRRASAAAIDQITRRCVELADLLDMPSIAIPPLGGGRGRGDKEEIVRIILEAAVDSLRHCRTLHTLIFAATDAATYLRYHNRIVAALVLAQRRQEIVALLPLIPPAHYQTAGRLLLAMDALRVQAGALPGTEALAAGVAALAAQAEAVAAIAAELAQALPEEVEGGVIAAAAAASQRIVHNIYHVAIAHGGGAAVAGGGAAAAGGGVAVAGSVYGDVQAQTGQG